jgi:hypothetical protein
MSSFESHSEPGAPDGLPTVPPDGYVLHPLTTLDGVLIYVTLYGEHVGTYFGSTETAATAAVASDLIARVDDSGDRA